MGDADSSHPLYESSVKLCAAVKKYKCLHDQIAHTKNAPLKCEEAWEMVAAECNESIEYCKNRWKSLRRSFFDGLKRKGGNKYYLHDHLSFLLRSWEKKSKRCAMDETNSTNSDSVKNNRERTAKTFKLYDDEDGKSFDSQTTSADESNDILSHEKAVSGVFIINEFGDDNSNYEPSVGYEEDKRHSFKRSCKKALDPNLINELVEEEGPEQKRARKSDKMSNKLYVPKLKITAQKVVETVPVKEKMVDSFTTMQPKIVKDVETQYDYNSSDFDEIFMQSIRNQLKEMNGRQKLNFKRKIYQSLMEVFDDGNDFPNGNKLLITDTNKPPSVVNTTVGELRLMRELVSLVQAAKVSPEIINAKEKVNSSTATPTTSKVNTKTPPATAEKQNNSRSKSPLAMSPTPDDELPFFIDDSDDEVELSLPRSWDEIKAKTGDSNKSVTMPENNLGLPRRLLQKVVRVSGSSGGTIVARDGDKKRIYRIIPKQHNPNLNNASSVNKNENSVNRVLVSTMKNSQDHRKDGASSVGTFYVSNNKNPQETTKFISNTANITIRPVNAVKTVQQITTNPSINNSNQASTSANTNSNTSGVSNGQTIFKNVHPANRILSSSTGYFKMISSSSSKPLMAASQNQKPSSGQPSPPVATNKVITTKLPFKTMTPPISNESTKKLPVRSSAQIMQRRFSICSSSLPEKQQPPLPTLNSTNNNSNAPSQSTISRIQISQPVSLNAKANNSATSSSVIAQHLATKQIPEVSSQPNTAKAGNNSGTKSPILETTLKQREIPVLETAGTVEADDLDPLFVTAPHVKSEPIDDDE